MKDKVVVDSHVRDLRHQIEKLTERLNDVSATNEKIATELLIVKNVNSNLEKSITALEKLQAKAEQYNRKNNVEISCISKTFRTMTMKKKLSRYVKIPILSLRPVI